MDDVDAVQAAIAKNMLTSGDWVTARLDGIKYLEKSPLIYWMMAASYALFGVTDSAARLPISLSILALCSVTFRMGRWAFGELVGLYAGLAMATSIGLFLFTRILIRDVVLTLTIALALWGFLRALDEEELHPRRWAWTMGAAIGTGLLLKGLIAALFPVAAAGLYLLFTRQLLAKRTWQRLYPVSSLGILLAIGLPWHVLATYRNPPYFDWTMKSEPGHYRGFFWFYFFNEHVFRFLNMRFPRDYNTVPRYLFWTLHLVWFFPWSAWIIQTARLSYRGDDRAARVRLLCLCWAGFTMVFFTFSTTQEYYSMPAYPAMALLLGSAMVATRSKWPARVAGMISAAALAAILFILSQVWTLPAPGDISQALVTQATEAYTLSMGHVGDLTLRSFAYLRGPLVLAGLAVLLGAVAVWRTGGRTLILALATMMVLFLNAARWAMITFDPYLSSQPLAMVLKQSPPGQVIIDNQYYTFSSIFFYTPLDRALLLNGRVNNLEYGSNEPGAPTVFLSDAELPAIWQSPQRQYLLIENPSVSRVQPWLKNFYLVRTIGGKSLYTNRALN
ncbi:MAG: glycosyltransferase family 39 protein [Bryobacteraceae bacterium]|nr:glycosyltransferase family 39 protein [Bryobacteraceae bacterium]